VALRRAGSYRPGRVDVHSERCDPGPPAGRKVWTIDSQLLEATDANRRLLEIGNWPTARYELNGKQVARAELPPRQALDAE
jgi:hypothetical protein